ncbi:SusC/RagA family TonB-linked outer membrane protein [Lacibacter sp. H407]|uniref:SusC/RagA family TonB-linked outer membrane protein n=1 Tax=Lacibacter sp. H407 TaxID=3133423 RepID=UPI0030C0A10E
MKVFLKIGLMFTFSLLSFLAGAQSIKVSGQVISKDDNAGLSGASVVVKAKNTGTQTDAEGRFSIEAAIGDILVISSVGYVSQEVKVETANSITIQLQSSASKMDEVVVVGYGTQRKSKITGSVSKLDPKVLQTGVRSNPASALAGTIPGLRVQQTSGRPGAVPNIVLRGGTNYNGSGSPLVLVDGLIRAGFFEVNQEDIESMEVLKDASATAIYGARANNGVILITTKKGKAGSSKITVGSKVGINKLNLPFEFLNARDYLYWSRNAVKTSGVYDASRLSQLTAAGPFGTGNRFLDGSGNVIDGNLNSLGVWSTMKLDNTNRHKLGDGWQTMIDPVNGTDTLIFNNFNYKDYALRPYSLTQDHNVSMSGGNDKGKYYAGFGMYDEKGLPINTFYRRYTFVLNSEYKIRSWLTSTSSLNFANAKWRDPVTNSEGNYLSRSLGAPPTMRGRNEKGDLLVGRDFGDGNPLVNDDKFIRNNNSDKFTMSQGFKIDLLKNLWLKTSANLFYDEGYNESFNKDYLQSPGNINRTRSSAASFGRTLSQTYNAVIDYNKSFGDHDLDLMAGSEYYDTYAYGVSASGSQAPSDDFLDLQYVRRDATTQPSVDSYHERQRILSFFGRATYDYKSKYLLTATVRRDGYSKLINNRWGTFPGVSVGWNVHKEDFFNVKWINALKLRASYGQNGNVSGISAYGLQGGYSVNRYNTSTGYLFSTPPFPDLLWERSSTYEVGAEGNLLGKIDFMIAYYKRVTSNKISSFNLPATSGITSLTTNNGSMQNQGVEVDVNYSIIRKKDLDVSFAANFAYNANKVLQLPNNGLENNRQGGFQVWDPSQKKMIWVGGIQQGQDPNVAYAYVADGLFRTQAELDAYANRVDLNGAKILLGTGKYAALTPAQRSSYFPIALGDVRWKDVDNNDTIDFRDRVYMGRTVPRFTGGFTAAARWKGLSVSARFDYALGFVAYDGPRAWFMGNAQGTFNTITDVHDTWSPTNTNAKFPTYYWADQLFKNNVLRESSMFYKKGDYLALREININYALPVKWASAIKSQGVNLSVTMQNVAYLSKATLYSPESGSIANSAAGFGGYPLPRIIIFGAQVTF